MKFLRSKIKKDGSDSLTFPRHIQAGEESETVRNPHTSLIFGRTKTKKDGKAYDKSKA